MTEPTKCLLCGMLALTIACETAKPPIPKDALPPNTRMISPMTDAQGNLQPTFESIAAIYSDCKTSKMKYKKGLVYFIDCRKK